MKTKQYLHLILFITVFVCDVLPTWGQSVRNPKEKTYYFGPGLKLKDKGLFLSKFNALSTTRITMHPRMPQILYSLEFSEVALNANLLTPDSLKHYQHRSFDERMESMKMGFQWDSTRVKLVRSYKGGDFDVKMFKVKCRNTERSKNGKHSYFIDRHTFWIVSCDTIIDNRLHVVIRSKTESGMQGRRAFRRIKNLELVEPERFPDFALSFGSDDHLWNDSLRYVTRRKENLLIQLPCMDSNSLYSQYYHIHSPELDSLLENFLYAELADSIVSRDYLNYKNMYVRGNDMLKSRYEAMGDVSVDRVLSIHRNMLDMKYGLDQFQNHLNNNQTPTVFDTLAILQCKFDIFENEIIYSKFEWYLKSVSNYGNFNKSGQGISYYNDIKDPAATLAHYENQYKRSLDVENDLMQLIHRKYLNGDGYVFGRRHLLDMANKDVYVFDPTDSTTDGNIIVTLSENLPGHWDVQLDTVDFGFDANLLSAMIPFNNKLLFKLYGEYIILDTTQTPFAFQQITIFPDSLFEYPTVCNVASNFEMFYTEINDVVDNTPKEYTMDMRYFGNGNRIDRNEFLQVIRHPNDVVYLFKDIEDINDDGLLDIYSFAICNGRVVYKQCLIESDRKLLEADSTSALKYLSKLPLFNNMITYSQMGNVTVNPLKEHE